MSWLFVPLCLQRAAQPPNARKTTTAKDKVSLPTYVQVHSHPVSKSGISFGPGTGPDSVSQRMKEKHGEPKVEDAQLRNEIFLYHPTIVQKVFEFFSH